MKQPSLDQSTLSKRARELARKDEDLAKWEEQLARREAAMDDTTTVSINLKVIEAKIEAKNEELVRLGRTIEQKADRNKEEIRVMDRKAEEADDRYKVSKVTAQKSLELVTELSVKAVEAKKVLIQVEQEIKDRKVYLLEQEELIEKSADEGNNKLQDVGREYKKFELEREELLTKLHADTTASTRLEDIITNQQLAIDNLRQRYEDAAIEYRQKLTDVKMEIATAQDEAKKVSAETDGKLLELRAERAEIEVAREVIVKQKADLVSEKRRLESQRSVYGL